MKNYDVLDELVPKTQELHRAIFNKGYEQGQKDILEQNEKTGKWIVAPKYVYAHLICDKCLSNAPYDCPTNYCPNCGARMSESQESEVNNG